MKKQYFTPQEIAARQLACPFSVGQAEPGRWTFCIGDKCLAWAWNPDQIENVEKREAVPVDEIEAGWSSTCEPYKKGKKMVVDLMKTPTHGRCSLVP